MIHRHSCWQMYIVDLTRVQSYSFQVPQHADTVELKRADWTEQTRENTQVLFTSRKNRISSFIVWNDPVQQCRAELFWCLGMCDFLNVVHACFSFFYKLFFFFFFYVTANICSFYWVVYSVGFFFCLFFGEPFGWTCTCVVTCVLQMLTFHLSVGPGFIDLWFLFLFWSCASVSIHAPVCQTSNCEFDTCFFSLQPHLFLKHKFICPRSEVGLWYVLMLLGCTLFSVLKKRQKKHQRKCNLRS